MDRGNTHGCGCGCVGEASSPWSMTPAQEEALRREQEPPPPKPDTPEVAFAKKRRRAAYQIHASLGSLRKEHFARQVYRGEPEKFSETIIKESLKKSAMSVEYANEALEEVREYAEAKQYPANKVLEERYGGQGIDPLAILFAHDELQ